MMEAKIESKTVTVSRLAKTYWSVFIWLLIFGSISAALQLDIPYPWDYDTAYHAVVGRLIREYGILHAFPWTPYSWLASHYADKELLFHLLFVPLAHLHWITAARIVGTIVGTTLLFTLYLILKVEKVRFAGIWSLISLSCSVFFIFRFTLVRPHLLSITLALIFLWAAVRCRLIILSAAAAIYPWAYVAFWQLPFLLLVAAESARMLSGARIQWKPAAVALAGIGVGVAVHPNTLNLLYINWIHMKDIFFASAMGSGDVYELGGEFAPYPLMAWVKGLLFSVVCIVVSAVYAWRNRRQDVLLLACTLTAFGFCVLTMKTQRFTEYFVPFSVLAMALALKRISWRFLPHALLIVTLLYTMAVGPGPFFGLPIPKREENIMPPNIEAYLQLQIPKYSQVFTTDWDYTGLLMLTLPERRFMVALDPTLFYKKDPELYRLWYGICRLGPADSAELIRRRFHARYVLGLNIPAARRFFAQLINDQSVRQLLISEHWMLFDLGEPEN
jgi:hypothetical protein